MDDLFRRFSTKVSLTAGRPWVFLLALTIVIGWAFTGPLFYFSNTWQLVINTGTTIVTFLMVFLIQNTQNRDTKAINLKLDELLKAVSGARTSLVTLEDRSDEDLAALQRQFERLHLHYTRIEQEQKRRRRLKKLSATGK